MTFFLLFLLVTGALAMRLPHVRLVGQKIGAAAISVALATPLGMPDVAMANDALAAANRAMRESNDRVEADTRKFSDLPDGAKKRRAMVGCKDKDVLKLAGYKNKAACVEDAMR